MSRMVCARRMGSSGSGGLGRPWATSQNEQRRVQTSPRIMKVAVPLLKHSWMLGQEASSHTVTSAFARSFAFNCCTALPCGSRTRIQEGLRSIGADALNDINALRMRTQEGFPNFGEVDDITNFEQIQRGLRCIEDEWIYMHRGLGIPGRIETLKDGTIKGPATDELFMREYIREWKRLMKAEPDIAIRREP